MADEVAARLDGGPDLRDVLRDARAHAEVEPEEVEGPALVQIVHEPRVALGEGKILREPELAGDGRNRRRGLGLVRAVVDADEPRGDRVVAFDVVADGPGPVEQLRLAAALELAYPRELRVVVRQRLEQPEGRVARADLEDAPRLHEAREVVEQRRGVLDAHVNTISPPRRVEECPVHVGPRREGFRDRRDVGVDGVEGRRLAVEERVRADHVLGAAPRRRALVEGPGLARLGHRLVADGLGKQEGRPGDGRHGRDEVLELRAGVELRLAALEVVAEVEQHGVPARVGAVVGVVGAGVVDPAAAGEARVDVRLERLDAVARVAVEPQPRVHLVREAKPVARARHVGGEARRQLVDERAVGPAGDLERRVVILAGVERREAAGALRRGDEPRALVAR